MKPLRFLPFAALVLSVLVVATSPTRADLGFSSTPGGPPGTAAYNPTWYAATDLYWDPGNACSCASDTNSGTSSGAPVLTFKEMVRRWGSRSPMLTPGQATTIHVLSSQTSGMATSDPIGTFSPSAPNGMIAIVGTLKAVGSSFSGSTVTQISRANPGNDFSVLLGTAGVTNGAAVGQLLYDSTVSGGSYCWIDSLTGSGATLTAVCTNPFLGSGLTTPTNNPSTAAPNGSSWSSGDTLQLYTAPTVYADVLSFNQGSASGSSGSSTTGVAWVQGLNFGDTATTAGSSSVTLRFTQQGVVSLVSSQALLQVYSDSTGAPLDNRILCSFAPNGAWISGIDLYGGAVGTTAAYLTTVGGALNVQLRYDIILHGSTTIGSGALTSAYNVHVPSGATVIVQSAGAMSLRAGGFNGALWGAGTVQPYQGGLVVNRSGSTWAATVLMAALKLTSNALTTGTVYSGTSFTNSVSITSANIDTYGAIFDVNSGARFTN